MGSWYWRWLCWFVGHDVKMLTSIDGICVRCDRTFFSYPATYPAREGTDND